MRYDKQTNTNPDVICHCLGVTRSEIVAAADFAGCRTICQVKNVTEAGTGCTACHRRILELLSASSTVAQSAASSPT